MRTYTNLRIAEGFHPLSHHGNNPQKQDKLVQIQTTHARVHESSSAAVEGTEADRTVLDHSTILFGSNMSNSADTTTTAACGDLGHANGRIRAAST